MTEEKFRVIDTGLTNKKNYQILQSVMGQLSDGKWQNSPRMQPYWKCAKIQMQGQKVVIKINQMTFYQQKDYAHPRVDRYTHKNYYPMKYIENPYSKMSDEAIKKWFGRKIKQLVFDECSPNGSMNWRRDNTEYQLDYFGYDQKLTISDAYFAYDTLMGRNTKNKRYSKFQQVLQSVMKDF